MKKVLLVSHGDFAKGIKQSLEVIVGTSDGVTAITIQKDTTRQEAQKEFQSFIQTIDAQDQIFAITDILAGSTSQYALDFLGEIANVTLLSGLNLGMLLELYVTDVKTSSQIDEILETAKNSITKITASKSASDEI